MPNVRIASRASRRPQTRRARKPSIVSPSSLAHTPSSRPRRQRRVPMRQRLPQAKPLAVSMATEVGVVNTATEAPVVNMANEAVVAVAVVDVAVAAGAAPKTVPRQRAREGKAPHLTPSTHRHRPSIAVNVTKATVNASPPHVRQSRRTNRSTPILRRRDLSRSRGARALNLHAPRRSSLPTRTPSQSRSPCGARARARAAARGAAGRARRGGTNSGANPQIPRRSGAESFRFVIRSFGSFAPRSPRGIPYGHPAGLPAVAFHAVANSQVREVGRSTLVFPGHVLHRAQS
jgi:hypothetical protein